MLAAESQEQGLSRNSSPQAIAAYRGIYDRFLAKFPLFFGYWKKYADLEFAIAGTEAAELVRDQTAVVGVLLIGCRYMSVAQRAFLTRLTFGKTIVPSRRRPHTTQIRFASKLSLCTLSQLLTLPPNLHIAHYSHQEDNPTHFGLLCQYLITSSSHHHPDSRERYVLSTLRR